MGFCFIFAATFVALALWHLFYILVAIAGGGAAATRAVVWCSSLKLCFQMIFQMCFLLLLPKKHIKNADINRNQ